MTEQRPLAQGTDPFIAANNLSSQESHFVQRCRERGITSVDPVALQYALRDAVMRGDEEVIKRVADGNDGCGIYRFRLDEGVFYAVIGEGNWWPRTVLTQEMKQNVKRAQKRRKRALSMAEHHKSMKRRGRK